MGMKLSSVWSNFQKGLSNGVKERFIRPFIVWKSKV